MLPGEKFRGEDVGFRHIAELPSNHEHNQNDQHEKNVPEGNMDL